MKTDPTQPSTSPAAVPDAALPSAVRVPSVSLNP